jgi:hypothetical protein
VKRIAWFALALSLFAAVPLYAQVAASNLRGKVSTEDGQPVPGASVKVTNQKTGAVRNTTTDVDGVYRLSGLVPGAYDILITLPGFADAKSAVTTQVGQTAEINLTMRPQALAGEMTVTAEAPLIEPTETDLSTVIAEEKIQNLPLAGRKWQDLAILAPGAAPGNGDFDGSFDPTKTRVGAISVGGNLGREVGVTIDGGDNTDDVVGGILMQFSADAIQEFEVVTQSYKAEFGKASNGLLNVVTKSGTNSLDGTAFGFFRNQSLREKTPAQIDAGVEKPDFHITQFGATVGGPIARDKTHFFLSYERLDEEKTFDIASGALEAFGPQGDGCLQSDGLFCIDQATVPQPFTQDLILGKIDHQLNDDQRLSLRVAFEFNENASGDQLGGSAAPTNAAIQTNDHISILGSHTWTIGDNALNELKIQYQDFENNIVAVDSSLPTVVFPDATFGANTNTPQTTVQTKFQFRDDFTYYAGSHTIKAGVEFIHEPTLGGNFAFLSSGVFFYDSNTSPLDAPTYFYIFSGNADLDNSLNQVGIYLQDDWEITPDVTLNLGIRYDVDPGELDLDRNQYTDNLAAAVREGRAPMFERDEIKDDTNNIAPRFGFAWDVGGKGTTVVRGSYGHFFDQPYDNLTIFNQFESKAPNECSSITNLPGARNCGPYRLFILPPGFGPDNIPDDPANYPGAEAGTAIRPVSPDFEYPFTRQITLGGTHQFNKNISVSADGVLAYGFNQFRRRWVEDSRDADPTDDNIFTTVDADGDGDIDSVPRTRIQESNGRSWYKSLQTSLQGRWEKVSLLLTYSLGEAEGTQNDFGGLPVFNDRRDEDFFEKGHIPGDLRHRGVLSATYVAPWDINIGTIIQATSAPSFTVSRGFLGTVADPTQSCAVAGNCRPDFENGEPIRFDVNGDGRVDATDRIGRGQLRGDEFFKIDVRLSKVFKFGDGYSVEVLAEAFNLTNADNFGSLAEGDVRSDVFGDPTLQLVGTPREFQLGARVRF